MKYFFPIFYSYFFFLPFTVVRAQQKPVPEALLTLADKLTSLKSVSYQYHREINNFKDNYFSQLTGTCYVEFNQTDGRSVSRFQMDSNDYLSIYNGTELFGLDKKTKTYSLNEQPQPRSLSSQSFLFNSIPTLRSVIQQIAESDSIPKYQRDTVIDAKRYQLLQLDLHRSSLQYLGSTMRFTKDVTIYYKILIDPVTGLPYTVLESNNIDKEGYNTKTTFTDINLNPKVPEQYSWYYSTYQKEFHPEKKVIGTSLIAVGSILSSDWSLPQFGEKKDENFDSSSSKGKLILLDFWIKNCGPCMESFPVLQQLQKKYGGDKFQLVSINAYDKKEEISYFYRREKPLYKMLYRGTGFAKSLGVNYYPTSVLIDKTGKVIYAGAFDQAVVEQLIKTNL